jgi:hypothetical protein
MAPNTGNLAPYAPLANVVGLIRRRREKGLPEILNTDKLTQLGIPDGNISRTLQALRFLNLIDEEGRQLASFNRLATAKENEYPNVLADIIRSAYHDAFAIIGTNPNDVTDRELVDAFRVYQPETQRNRMIILFRGLCQEAGLLAGGPPETRTRKRTGTSGKPSSPYSNGAKKPQPEPKDTVFESEPYQVSTQQASQSETVTPITSTEEYAIMQGVLRKLPFAKRAWTQTQREKWLKAVAANVDMLFELEDPDTGVGMDEDMYRP